MRNEVRCGNDASRERHTMAARGKSAFQPVQLGHVREGTPLLDSRNRAFCPTSPAPQSTQSRLLSNQPGSQATQSRLLPNRFRRALKRIAAPHPHNHASCPTSPAPQLVQSEPHLEEIRDDSSIARVSELEIRENSAIDRPSGIFRWLIRSIGSPSRISSR